MEDGDEDDNGAREEEDVSHKGVSRDMKGSDERDSTDDDGHDCSVSRATLSALTEAGSPDELPYGEAERASFQRGEGRENIRTPIPEGEEGDSRSGLGETEICRDSGEVGTKKVGGRDADEREEEDEDDDVAEGDERFKRVRRVCIP